MYNLPYFKAGNQEEVIAFMQQHPFVTLCAVDGNNCPVATQVPVVMEWRNNKLYLQGHIQRKTDHHLAMEYNANVLAIFTSGHAYISAQWYKPQNVASTWNYQSVHVKGEVCFKNEAWLITLLEKLTSHFENDANSPSLLQNMSADYVSQMAKAIVGFEIEVSEIDHVFKLSQNKDDETRQNIIAHLEKKADGSSLAVANAMKRLSKS